MSISTDPSSCHHADAWMALQSAGLATREERLGLQSHLKACDACRRVLEACPLPAPRAPSRRRHRVAIAVGVVALAAASILVVQSSRDEDEAPIVAEWAASTARNAEAPVRPARSADRESATHSSERPAPAPSRKIAKPPARPSPARASALTPGQVSLVVAGHRSEIHNMCWAGRDRQAASMAIKSLRVDLSLAISAAGNVESARQRTSDGRLSDVGACIAARARQWKFPRMPGPSRVSVPFVFETTQSY